MKKSLTILVMLTVALGAMAQRGTWKALAVDTLKGDNNQVLGEIPVTGAYDALFITVKVDRISTAAGGTLYLKAGKDAASALVANQSTNSDYSFAPNDTLATSDVATQYWNIYIKNPDATYYQIFGDGDASDTIKITTQYFLKK